jgi:hypothetical protein
MIIYCDRLSWSSYKKAVSLRCLSDFSEKPTDLRVLDPLSSDLKTRLLLRFMSGKFQVREESFIAGKLLMPDGQPVYIAARRCAHDVAFMASQRLLDRSPLLSQLNQKWGRNTTLLYLAKFLWAPVNKIIVRILVTDALLREFGKEARLIISIPAYLDADLFSSFSTRLTLEYYREGWGQRSLQQVYGLLWLFRQKLLETRWFIEKLRKNQFPAPLHTDEKPSLLTIQEDEISSDRSYRTQPHWLDPADPLPAFRTLILKTSVREKGRKPEEGKVAETVLTIPMAAWCLPGVFREHHSVEKKLTKDLKDCIRASLYGSAYEKAAMFSMIKLFYTARDLAPFCVRYRVKAFMTCENYMIFSDAMQLIASPLNIRTLSFQYSNMGMVGPYMLTTADLMITFSPVFHERWIRKCEGVVPGCFFDAGYVYDSSFKYLQKRAEQHRKRLMDAGAFFVICYFDENAFKGKYEMVTQDDLKEEIQILMERVIEDPLLGLIIKNQFQWNAVCQFHDLSDLRTEALSTGRYIELSHGTVRNIIFPAEAALAADIAIGHVVGATAPLEAALSGTRTLLLNPYGMKNENDTFYEKADIVYSTIQVALDAINELREGESVRSALGDWSPILQHFDPYRDGQSARRLRIILEEIITGNSINITQTTPLLKDLLKASSDPHEMNSN